MRWNGRYINRFRPQYRTAIIRNMVLTRSMVRWNRVAALHLLRNVRLYRSVCREFDERRRNMLKGVKHAAAA